MKRARPRWRRAAPCLLVWLLACVGGGSQPDPPDTAAGGSSSGRDCPSDLPTRAACDAGVPSYRFEVAPVFEQRCASCHFPGNTLSGDVFREYVDVYDQRQTVLTRIYACVMPPEVAPPLTPAERQTLLEWFVCGAPDN
jgi:hypothetical protein